jgi:MoaA/NifB/PqqE/SkfB family radical SAM enzyme
MDPDLLRTILRKAKSECEIVGIGLFNWTEPILHPKLPELVRIVQEEEGHSCYLSSNLNTLRNLDALMAANPYSIRISNSGITPEIYEYSHRGGDIERVKIHMQQLAAAKKKHKATTRVHVLFHRYKHNLSDEPKMRAYAETLGFEFQPVWAFMMPLEKILAYAYNGPTDPDLTEEDRGLIDNLALPLRDAMDAAEKHKGDPCSLLDRQITMDYKGDVQLCCATYDARKFTVGNYLTSSLDEIQKVKIKHNMCGRCAAKGGHVYVTYGAPEFEEIAAKNIGAEGVRMLDLDYERKQKQVRKSLEKIYQRFFSSVISPEKSAVLGKKYDRLQRSFRTFTKS